MMRGLLGARTHTARSSRRSCRPLAQSLIEAGFVMMRGLLGARTHTARSGRRSCRPLAQSLIEAGFDRVDSCFVKT